MRTEINVLKSKNFRYNKDFSVRGTDNLFNIKKVLNVCSKHWHRILFNEHVVLEYIKWTFN